MTITRTLQQIRLHWTHRERERLRHKERQRSANRLREGEGGRGRRKRVQKQKQHRKYTIQIGEKKAVDDQEENHKLGKLF